jgi:hypothetical protein
VLNFPSSCVPEKSPPLGLVPLPDTPAFSCLPKISSFFLNLCLV